MGGETMAEVLFSSLWKKSCKPSVRCPERRVIDVLSWEVASLMSKLVNVWRCLEDRQLMRLREELFNSHGIQIFVSEDNEYLIRLALEEVMENVSYVARAVTVLGQRCADIVYQQLKQVFDDPGEIDLKWSGWEYKPKKMQRRVKKMERFIAVTTQLYHEQEVLAELEQSLRRMQGIPNTSQVKLLEFQQKVFWQQQEVKNLREMGPWVRTYDYTVRLLLRSILTIMQRVKNILGIDQIGSVKENYGCEYRKGKGHIRANSISSLMESSVQNADNNLSGFQSARLGRSFSSLGISGEKKWLIYTKLMKSKRFPAVGSFKGCMTRIDTPIPESMNRKRDDFLGSNDIHLVSFGCKSTTKLYSFSFKHKQLIAPSSTLGYAALDLHYANIIILIEKLASSPHLISLDAKDDLYNMLPTIIKTSLRTKLKTFSRNSSSSVYDVALAAEWKSSLARILDWLSPLSHKMIKWYSERSFEKQRMSSGENVLLVQTLYFASKDKTECAITELLMGLNYLSRFYKDLSERPVLDSPCRRSCDFYLFRKDPVSHSMMNYMS